MAMSYQNYCDDYHGEPNVDFALHMPVLEGFAAKAGFVLEIGCGAGNGSTRAIQAGLARSPYGKLHVSVDINLYQPCYERPEVDWWWKVTGDSRDPRTLLKVQGIVGGLRADVIFIDTHHTYEVMKAELALWPAMANDRTIWLFHDTWMLGAYNTMTDGIKEYAQSAGLVYEDLSVDSHGLGYMSVKCLDAPTLKK